MAVTIKSSGPRGAKTYEVRVDGQLYHYTDTLADARRSAAQARAIQRQRGARKNPTKAQKREKAKRKAKASRIMAALKNFIRKANPAATGATVTRLKGGGFNIRPIKATSSRGRR